MKIKFKLPKRIIDLIRLAGHGNNTERNLEALSAARHLYKILENQKFEFTVNVPDSSPRTEPMWKSEPQEPDRKYQEDFFRKYKGPKWWEDIPYEEMFRDNPFTQNMNPDEKAKWYEKAEEFREGAWSKNRPPPGPSSNYRGEPRHLRCKTCKATLLTKFVGLEELFECNDCQWSAYARGERK